MSGSIRDADTRSEMQPPSSSTGSLLEQVHAGNPESWRRFVFLYAPLILSQCHRAGLREHDAEEVAQEVFQTVAVKLVDFRSGRGRSRPESLVTPHRPQQDRRLLTGEPATNPKQPVDPTPRSSWQRSRTA